MSSVEVLWDVLFKLTLPSLMFTRVRFVIQIKGTGTVEEFADHNSDRYGPNNERRAHTV